MSHNIVVSIPDCQGCKKRKTCEEPCIFVAEIRNIDKAERIKDIRNNKEKYYSVIFELRDIELRTIGGMLLVDIPVTEIAKLLGFSRPTVYRKIDELLILIDSAHPLYQPPPLPTPQELLSSLKQRRKNLKLLGLIFGTSVASERKEIDMIISEIEGTYPPEWTVQLKWKVRARDGYACQVCEKRQDQEAEPMSVHHVDYNKGNCEFNNLITLCRSCHSRTNVNRDYWEALFAEML